MVDDTKELSKIISDIALRRGALLISKFEINLKEKSDNKIYILKLETSSSSGGRAGGFGSRTADRIYCFEIVDKICTKLFEYYERAIIDYIELPYHSSAVSIYMENGEEEIGSGVIDSDLVDEYDNIIKDNC